MRASMLTLSAGASRSAINFKICGKKCTLAETSSALPRWSDTQRTRPTRSLTGRVVVPLREPEELVLSGWPPSHG